MTEHWDTADARPLVDALLRPRSIAVVGASADPQKLPGRPVAYLKKFGYEGRIFPINPGREEVQGLPCHPSLEHVEGDIDLVLVMTSAKMVPETLRAAGRKGASCVIVAASGFAEVGEHGFAYQAELELAIAESGVRVLGPNCLGVIGFGNGVVPTFTPMLGERNQLENGNVGFVSQSGAVGTFLMDEMHEQRVGMSFYVATGNEVDLQVAEVLGALLDEGSSEVLLGYLEGISDGESLIDVAQRAHAHDVPMVVLKAGRSAAGSRAAGSHTASLSGDDAVFDALVRQMGVVRVDSQEELLEAAQVFSTGRRANGRRLTVMSESGGAGVLMTDAAVAHGLQVDPWEESWRSRLAALLPEYGSATNPVDLTAALITDQSTLGSALDLAAEHPDTDLLCVLVGNADSFADPLIAQIERIYKQTDKPIAVVWTGGTGEPRRRLRELGIPCFTDPNRAARALSWVADYSLRHPLPRPERPRDLRPDEVRAAIAAARSRGAQTLDEFTSAAALAAYGIPTAASFTANDPEEAVAAAARLSGPCVLKILSDQVSHKSELGAVRLNLDSPHAVRDAAAELLRIGQAIPGEVRLLVQAMEPGVVEMMIGGRVDSAFGPIVLVGLGGVFVEVLKDFRIASAPLDRLTAERMCRSLRAASLLDGARGQPPVDVPAICEVLERLSWFLHDFAADIAEVDLNPLMARTDGVHAVDALILLRPADRPSKTQAVLRPHPHKENN